MYCQAQARQGAQLADVIRQRNQLVAGHAHPLQPYQQEDAGRQILQVVAAPPTTMTGSVLCRSYTDCIRRLMHGHVLYIRHCKTAA
jgi:hypothetical protein